jgi:hypothetical protein
MGAALQHSLPDTAQRAWLPMRTMGAARVHASVFLFFVLCCDLLGFGDSAGGGAREPLGGDRGAISHEAGGSIHSPPPPPPPPRPKKVPLFTLNCISGV